MSLPPDQVGTQTKLDIGRLSSFASRTVAKNSGTVTANVVIGVAHAAVFIASSYSLRLIRKVSSSTATHRLSSRDAEQTITRSRLDLRDELFVRAGQVDQLPGPSLEWV